MENGEIVFGGGGRSPSYCLVRDEEELARALKKRGFHLPNRNDWKFDETLAQDVLGEMLRNAMQYAISTDADRGMLHRIAPGAGFFCVPLKYLRPTTRHNVALTINGKQYRYFMTNEHSELDKKLAELHCLMPHKDDWKKNLQLSPTVAGKMARLGATYSITLDHGSKILNYYREGEIPFIINIEEFIQKQASKIKGGFIAQSIQKDTTDLLKNMLRIKFNLEEPIFNNFTPLMAAAFENAQKVVRFLVENGANVNTVNSEGMSALMLAAGNGSKEVAEILLSHGADPQLKSKNGWTARVYALMRNHEDIAETLDGKQAVQGKTEHLPFHEKVNFFIGRFAKPCEIYQRLHGFMSRQTFSKLRSKAERPKKRNVLFLAVGMKLSIEETEELLFSAGLALSETDAEDRAFSKFIRGKDYDIFKIDGELWNTAGKSLQDKKRKKPKMSPRS